MVERRRGLWWGEVAGGFVLAVLIVVTLGALAIYVASGTGWGHERIRRYAVNVLQKEASGGIVRIGRIDGNLLTGMVVHDLVITDKAGNPFVAVKRITGEYGIGDLINKRVWVNNIVLERPLIVLDNGPTTEWNWKRIFPKDTTPHVSSGKLGWTDQLRFNNVKIIDGHVTVRNPWRPSKRLDKAGADSAVRAALSGDSRVLVVKAPGGYQKVTELKSVNAFLTSLRLTDPAYHESVADVATLQMEAYPFRPPGAEVKDFRGRLHFNGDSAYWKGVNARLSGTVASGDGSYVFSTGDLTLQVHADPANFADLRWVHPRIPSAARGKLDFGMKWREGFEEYTGTNADIRVGNAHVLGKLTATFTDTVAVRDADLRFTELPTTLLEQIFEKFKSPWRGIMTGRATMHGGVNAMVFDGDVVFADSRAGTSHLIGAGEIGFPGTAVRFRDVHMRMLPLQVEMARVYTPNLKISGTLRGVATVNGNTLGEMRIVGDVEHVDRGARSLVAGRVNYTLKGTERYDVDVVAKPLSLVEVGRFMPTAELRGFASGPIKAKGPLSNLVVQANVGLSGGGHLDVGSPGTELEFAL